MSSVVIAQKRLVFNVFVNSRCVAVHKYIFWMLILRQINNRFIKTKVSSVVIGLKRATLVFSVFLKQLLYCSRLRIPLSFATKRLNSPNRMWLDRPPSCEVGVRVMSPDEKNRSDHGKSWTLLITILFSSNAGDVSLRDIFISALSAGAISYAKQTAAFWFADR